MMATSRQQQAGRAASSEYEPTLEFLSIKLQDGPLTSRLQHVRPGDTVFLGRKASQGGGHAAYIAKQHSVDRAVYFGSPADANASGLAPWVSAVGTTPGPRQAGFTHLRDQLATLTVVSATWRVLGLGGALTLVDGVAAPYGGATPLLAPVWRALLVD